MVAVLDQLCLISKCRNWQTGWREGTVLLPCKQGQCVCQILLFLCQTVHKSYPYFKPAEYVEKGQISIQASWIRKWGPGYINIEYWYEKFILVWIWWRFLSFASIWWQHLMLEQDQDLTFWLLDLTKKGDKNHQNHLFVHAALCIMHFKKFYIIIVYNEKQFYFVINVNNDTRHRTLYITSVVPSVCLRGALGHISPRKAL